MNQFTLYADIYPSGHKSIIEALKEAVDEGMPRLTGVISQHETSNGYWSNIQGCADDVLVEPPLTKSFYRKEINDHGDLVVQRKIQSKHMPYTDFWGEIVEDSIADALRKPTKGEAIISPVVDTYAVTEAPLAALQSDPYSIKASGHSPEFERFNKQMAQYVVDLVHRKEGDRRPIFAGIFLDSDRIRDPNFLALIDSYANLDLGGYFLVMQDIDYSSDSRKLTALKEFIERVLSKTPSRKIILYRSGMLGALYSAFFPEARIGSTYGLPYRDSYSIRNINPAKETRPLKSSKLVYSPVLLTTVKIPDALATWRTIGVEITPHEAEQNFTSMIYMAKKTQEFARELNAATDKRIFLKDWVQRGIDVVNANRVRIDQSYASHLRNWANLL